MESLVDFLKTYTDLFSTSTYNRHDLNERKYSLARDILKEFRFNKVLDIGSGRGNLYLSLVRDFSDLDYTSCDLDKFHPHDTKHINADLTQQESLLSLSGSYDVICILDFLEHIPMEECKALLNHCAGISKFFVFAIATNSDKCGGLELHINQEPKSVWDKILGSYVDIKHVENPGNKNLLLYTGKQKI